MDEVDDFLAHYGVKGMKWGKRRAKFDSTSDKPKMSRKKKIAIAVGVGAVVAVGTVAAVSIMNGKKSSLPVQSLTTNRSMINGRANLIFNAASMAANSPAPAAPRRSLSDKAKEKAFNKAKAVAINRAQNMSYDDFKAMVDKTPNPRTGVLDKIKGAAIDRAKEIALNKISNVTAAQAAQLAKARTNR